ncbi:MAG: tRNA (cytidine(56)-2'-O)-methyltransferase [Thermoplasmatota archaeon]
MRILRLGHRPERDKRVTTHVCLTARAFGARGAVIAEPDAKLVESIRAVGKQWGGGFTIESGVPWKPYVRAFPGPKVHLTMYGEPFGGVVPKLDPKGPLLIVVGAEKVPREIYDMADYNVSVGNQPHSEVAALAVFLYELLGPAILGGPMPGARRTIVPNPRGKTVVQGRDGGERAG